MNTVTYEQVLIALYGGAFDDALHDMNRAVVDRIKYLRKVKVSQMAGTIKKGDRVRFGESLSPAYLRGVEAEVQIAHPSGKLSVQVVPEHQYRARRFGHGPVKVSVASVELVEGRS